MMAEGVDITQEQSVWGTADTLDFYTRHRNTPDELYPSERFFLPDLVAASASCLDIGCAAGGFARIMKSFNPAIDYTGVDVVPEFVARARAAYPDACFEIGDGVNFATPPCSYDLVHASGILHLNSRYRDVLHAGYSQARGTLLCDFRLTWGPAITGTFRVGGELGAGKLPYIVLNVDALLHELRALTPAPRLIHLRGYFHRPSPATTIAIDQVLMAFARIAKGRSRDATEVVVDLPREADG